MGSNFNIKFNSSGNSNIQKYSSQMVNMQSSSGTSVTAQQTVEPDYGEAEEFDYEEYLSNESKEFDLETFYKDQMMTALQYKTFFDQTLQEVENEKRELEYAYSSVMTVGSNEIMYGLVSFDGYRYATVDEYILYYQGLIDPNSCMDSNYMFSQEIYNQKMAEAEANARRDYEDKFNSSFEQAMGMTYQEYQDKMSSLNNDITTLKSMKYVLTQQLKELPYSALASTNQFQDYKSAHANMSDSNLEDAVLDYVESLYPNSNSMKSMMTNVIVESLNSYLLSDDDKIMCLYLLENRGLEDVQKYLTAIEDRINQALGRKEADDFIASISTNGEIDVNLWNGAKTAGKGLMDGIENFGEGIMNLFTTEGMISSNQYAQMYILEALNESKIMSGTYQFSVSAGNMVPAMAVSVLVSAVATPAAGSVAGSTLMGLSAGGNAKNQALINGHSLVEAYIYGGCVGLSETTLGYFLGKMPGLSKTSSFTVKNLLMEGVEEFSQEWIDAGLQVAILGEDVDWSKIPEQSASAFVMGILMAGLFEGGQTAINLVISGINYKINVQKTLDYIEIHPDIPIEEALLLANDIQLLESSPVLDNSANILPQQIDGRTTINGNIGLNVTSLMISIQTLIDLLTNQETFDKFLDYDNNIEFFDSNSRQAYISALETYYNELIKRGITLDSNQMNRYNQIQEMSEAITDVSSIAFNNSTFANMNLNFMNHVLSDTNAYTLFKNTLTTMDNTSAFTALSPYHEIYTLAWNQNSVLSTQLESRLVELNTLYLNTINHNTIYFSQFSEYGANQHCVQNLANNPSKNRALYNILSSIVTKYFPDMRKAEINRFLRSIDVNGVCSYATVLNEIISFYEGKEAQFRQDFGYDLYRIENGVKVLNDEILLTELYCITNQYNTNVISMNNKGRPVILGDANQIYMSYIDLNGNAIKDVATIQYFLAKKGIHRVWNSDVIFYYDLSASPLASLGDQAINTIRNKIVTSLAAGHTVEIDVFSVRGKPYPYTLYSTDINTHNNILMDDSLGGTHAAGHSMFITGITENGDIIVSSWGGEYILKFSEIRHRNIALLESFLH